MLFSPLRVIVFASVVLAAGLLPAVEIPEPSGIPERHLVPLDSPWVSLTTGGAGRYLVLHLKEARKLALFDVSTGGIRQTIDAPGDDVMLAAGIDKLAVLVPSQNILHRYDLATLKREKSFPTPTGFKPTKMVMGSASRGPLVCHTSGPVQLFDLDTFKPLEVRGEVLASSTFGDWGYELTVSGNGETVVGWVPGISGQHFFVMKLSGAGASITKTPEGYSDAGRYFRPNADASLFFRNGASIFDANVKELATDHLKDHILLACDDPNFFLAVQPRDAEKTADAWICSSATLQKIAVVKDVGHVLEGLIGADRGHWRFEPRVRWLPTANTLVSLPAGQSEVRLVRANLKELLDEAGGDYLHIVSSPPRTAWVGRPYVHKIEVLSSSKKVAFQAETAPDGFTISSKGEVKWTPKAKPVGGLERVVIAISAGDKEAFHSFEIAVERGAGQVASSAAGRSRPPDAAAQPASPGGARSSAASAAGEPVKIDEARLEIPAGTYLVSPGEGFRTHLLLQGSRLTVLGPDGITPEKTIDLKRPYVRIAERAKYYVAVSKDPVAVEQLDKRTLKAAGSVKFTAHDITDLALHPTRPLAYVAYKADVTFPRYRFLIYDEAKGEGRQSEEYLGTFLAVDPGGKFLLAGYRDIYERGANFIFNPDRIHVVPDFGSVDWLLRYDLDRRGLPQFSAIHEKAGGNGKGIRLSRDGKRVSYLSVVGSPPFSGSLCAWDVGDFKKVPTMFAIKDPATTEELAYHPFLPWVACLGKNGEPLLFDRESGEPVSGKAPAPDLAGGKAHALWFAADGRAVVLDTSVNDIRYWQRVPLKLSSREQQACENAYKKLSTADTALGSASLGARAPAEKVPLAALHALQGGAGSPMSAKDVAKAFTDAVVVVTTDNGNGTGMLVGSDGYILTCAHCVADAEEIHVSYRRPVQGQIRSVTTEARLLAADDVRDLALLKIPVPFPLATVRLGSSAGLESGARVYVIGNPGVNTTILDHTITEGIISSPSRKIGDQTYIQTSAQVNPGSSGGPLFDENGLVVGQVVLKARLEGAGFATPADEILGFLIRGADLSEGLNLRRQWVDSTGSYQVDATLVEIGAESVKLRKTDGTEVLTPIRRLSKPDQSLVEVLRKRLPRK